MQFSQMAEDVAALPEEKVPAGQLKQLEEPVFG
jgi:hypothetical protein